MSIYKNMLKLVMVLLIAILISWAAIFVLGIRQKDRAEAFLSDITRLKLGEASFADAEELARRYNGRPWNALPQTANCTAQECYLSFDFSDPYKRLPFMYRPRVTFGGIVHVHEGIVVGIELFYQLGIRSGRQVIYDVRDVLTEGLHAPGVGYRWESPGYGIAALKVDKYGFPWVLKIELNRNSTDLERREAYSINLSCLANGYNCTSPPDIIPSEVLRAAMNQNNSDVR